jgi:RNA binding exosome subunit
MIKIELETNLINRIKAQFEGATTADKVAAFLNSRREFEGNRYIITEIDERLDGTTARGYLQKLANQ